MEDMTGDRISRRRMLKRIGAGAAVAWSAPILTSLGTPAFARHLYAPCEGHPFECGGAVEVCGQCTGSFGDPTCACDQTAEGDLRCFCANCACPCSGACTKSSDCTDGSFCYPTTCCGGGVCIRDCSVGYAPQAAGAAAGGTNPLGVSV